MTNDDYHRKKLKKLENSSSTRSTPTSEKASLKKFYGSVGLFSLQCLLGSQKKEK